MSQHAKWNFRTLFGAASLEVVDAVLIHPLGFTSKFPWFTRPLHQIAAADHQGLASILVAEGAVMTMQLPRRCNSTGLGAMLAIEHSSAPVH